MAISGIIRWLHGCMAGRYGWMEDTDPQAFRVLIELRRRMTFDQKFRHFLEMSEMVLHGYEDRVRREHPEAGERKAFLRGATLRLENETVRRVYGWSPDDGVKS